MPLDIDRTVQETFVARAEYHPSLGSTNDRAAGGRVARRRQLPLLVLADRQTAGRGRGTNRWWTGPGAWRSACWSMAGRLAPVAAARLWWPWPWRWPWSMRSPRCCPGNAGHPLAERRDCRPAEIGRHSHRGAARSPPRHRHRTEHQQFAGRCPGGIAVHGGHAPRPRPAKLRSDGDAHRTAASVWRASFARLGHEPQSVAARADALVFAARPDVDAPGNGAHRHRPLPGASPPTGPSWLETSAGTEAFFSGTLLPSLEQCR